MTSQTRFPRDFFEIELPKLLELTDTYKNLPVISIGLCDGSHLELRDFKVTPDGLLVTGSAEEQLVPYPSILSLQVMPQALKQTLARKGWPQINVLSL